MEVVYLDAITGEQVTLNPTEKLLNAIYGTQICAKIYTKVGTVSSKTLKAMEANLWAFAKENNLGCDFEIYRFGKGR